jgi:hypothetical protein
VFVLHIYLSGIGARLDAVRARLEQQKRLAEQQRSASQTASTLMMNSRPPTPQISAGWPEQHGVPERFKYRALDISSIDVNGNNDSIATTATTTASSVSSLLSSTAPSLNELDKMMASVSAITPIAPRHAPSSLVASSLNELRSPLSTISNNRNNVSVTPSFASPSNGKVAAVTITKRPKLARTPPAAGDAMIAATKENVVAILTKPSR